MLSLFKRLWWLWKGLAHELISAQNWVLMAFVYWVAVAPIAVIFKLIQRRPADEIAEPATTDTFWIERSAPPLTMKRAKRMF